MTHPPINDPNMPLEVGRLLKLERIRQGLSIEDLCKKMGTRVQQIEAVESEDNVITIDGEQEESKKQATDTSEQLFVDALMGRRKL